MVTFADTSFLFSLYANDAHTPQALAWMKRQKTALTISVLSEFELGNALRFAEFRKGIPSGEAALFWSQFEADRARGRILVPVCNLAQVIDEAKRLSATHTLMGGHRSFDILHVAGALLVKARRFLTFDANQRKLADSQGMNVPL